MRLMALLFALLSMPIVVAAPVLAQQTQQRSSGSGSQANQTSRHPGDYCTRHCRANEVPCGDGCLASGGKSTCAAKRTTTCAGKP
jgi:hypothetical protein